MRRPMRTLARAVLATVLGMLSVPFAVSTGAYTQTLPTYNPYTPPSILPADMNSEISRVRREVQTIFGRYFAEWQALTPTPTYDRPTRQYLYRTDMMHSGYWAGY